MIYIKKNNDAKSGSYINRKAIEELYLLQNLV